MFFDGTNVDFIDLGPQVGGVVTMFLKTQNATSIPAWIAACTVPPFININNFESGPPGSISFNAATYPVLFDLLGTTALPNAFPGQVAYSGFNSIVTFIRAA